ncbi:MAG: hypothetical protein HY342_08410 [Candidatus Lambdaproteobacteria bacterium]|nr:hypothetical protein [Candidatus Lambdaproteobacteria bacterium]
MTMPLLRRAIPAALLPAAALALLLAAVLPAQAQPAKHLARFYYSEMASGEVQRTPLDPDAAYAGEPLDAGAKGELEVILWRRVGIGASRQTVARKFEDAAGRDLRENWVQYSANVTLYLLESRHDAFNLFIGGGVGSVERYKSSIDRVPQTIQGLHTDLQLTRWLGGLEYTWERIGIRLEVSGVEASKSDGGQQAELAGQTYQHVTFYIPFN